FSGQGSQYINMGRELYENEAFFRDTIDRCASLLHSELELDIRDILYPAVGQEQAAADQLKQTALTQPALFVVEYALARLLMHWGIIPVAMVGHSIGEYVAACIADVFSVEDALRLVALRGRLMQGLPAGAMLSVGMHEADIEAILPEELSLAALNAPASSVVSGPTEAINAFRRRLEESGISERVLHTSHAFHSGMMDPILDEFTAAVADIELHAPTIPYISNVTGDWISEQQVCDPAYWSQHLRQAVRFADGVRLLVETSNQTLLEVGPGNTLSALARQTIGPVTGALVLNTMHHPTDSQPAQAYLLNALGRLWASGVKIDWASYYADEQRRRVSLPTYPFERQRYWVTDGRELKDVSLQSDKAKMLEQQYINVETSVFHPRPELQGSYCGPSNELEWRIVSIWQDLFGIEKVGVYDNFFDLGGDSMLAIQLAARLQEHFEVALQFGEVFESPTVAEQAVRIAEITEAGDAAVTRVSNPIVRIQPKGDRPIFFCVHPAGGIVHCYTELARYLGKDQPFYALQHPGMDGPYEPYIEFDITAEYYVKALRAVQPEGPYYLGGWSFGGTLAFEMAQQLQRQGEEVAFLVMIDSPGPDFINGECRRPAFDDTGIFTFLSKGVSGIFQNKLELNHSEFHQLSEAEKFDYILQNAGDINDAKSLEAGREQLGRVIEMFKVSDYAERHYESSIYHGKITMLRVQNIDDYEYTGYKEHPELSNPTFGWDKLSSHEVDVHFVPGTHMTMVAKPHVQELAKTLRRCLDSAFLEQSVLQLEQA
ncbi:MAG TPA: alpha/beta fold hydrolase, partial [Gammaproteobacteria bacterium]|nr:alpha/beta fold hydrolase [Gammaproteobacteria bacterium]